jgi:hypothetical protein
MASRFRACLVVGLSLISVSAAALAALLGRESDQRRSVRAQRREPRLHKRVFPPGAAQPRWVLGSRRTRPTLPNAQYVLTMPTASNEPFIACSEDTVNVA